MTHLIKNLQNGDRKNRIAAIFTALANGDRKVQNRVMIIGTLVLFGLTLLIANAFGVRIDWRA